MHLLSCSLPKDSLSLQIWLYYNAWSLQYCSLRMTTSDVRLLKVGVWGVWWEGFEQSGVYGKSTISKKKKGATIYNEKKFVCVLLRPPSRSIYVCATVSVNSLVFVACQIYIGFILWDIVIFGGVFLLCLSLTALNHVVLPCYSCLLPIFHVNLQLYSNYSLICWK